MNQQLLQEFNDRFGTAAESARLFFCPGRVNLIGEHTDYNGGYVFPCALSFGTYLYIRKREDDLIRFASTNFYYSIDLKLDKVNKKQGDNWVNYPLGVINQLLERGIKIDKGFDMLYSGNIPNGAGLSSSASIEVLTAFALNALFDGGLEVLEMVKLSQAAENKFVGVNCGIMDQFAVGMGAKNQALALKCDTLDYEKVPVILNGLKIVISNTNKRRGLADSKYNERRSECELAVKQLSTKKSINQLSDLDFATFNQLQDAIPDETVRRRAKHVISENQRVLDAVKALKNNELEKFGQLMNQSHDSLRYDYEVTGAELDALVEEARKIPGVLGSRMTGAGFGGCTVSIVKEDSVENFKKTVAIEYEKRTGLKPDFYIADIGDGVKEIC